MEPPPRLFFGPEPGRQDGSGGESETASGGRRDSSLRALRRTLTRLGTSDLREEIHKILEEDNKILIGVYGVAFLVAYMAAGVVAFSFAFEDWGVIDSLYFSMVTFTTVGYGDLAPETQCGRIFAIFYALSGIVFIAEIIGKIGENLVDRQVETIKAMDRIVEESKIGLVKERTVAVEAADPLDPTQGRGLFKTIILPHMPFFILFLFGACIVGKDQAWSFVDILYYATCTLTTIGYGDLAPDDPVSRMVAVFLVPFSVFALASVLSKRADLAVERKVRKAQQFIRDRPLHMSHLKVYDRDGDEVVQRHEFLEFMLLSMDKVDEGLLGRLNDAFDRLDRDGSGKLDKQDLIAKIQYPRGSTHQNRVDEMQPVETTMLLDA